MVFDFSLQGYEAVETFRITGYDITEAIGKALAAYDELHGTDPLSLSCYVVVE